MFLKEQKKTQYAITFKNKRHVSFYFFNFFFTYVIIKIKLFFLFFLFPFQGEFFIQATE